MNSHLVFAVAVAVPLFIVAGCLDLILLAAVACALAVLGRCVRLRVRLLRRGRVPADGAPLTADEMYLFAGVQRGWKQRAPKPQYQDESEW